MSVRPCHQYRLSHLLFLSAVCLCVHLFIYSSTNSPSLCLSKSHFMSPDRLGIQLTVLWCSSRANGGNYLPADIRHGRPPNTSVEVICALLECYAAYIGNALRTFRGNMSTLEDGADRFSWNVGKELPTVF